MARIDDGELYLEIEGATEEQLCAGLGAARRHLVGCGVNVARNACRGSPRGASSEGGALGSRQVRSSR